MRGSRSPPDTPRKVASVSTDIDHGSFDVAAHVVEATIDSERTASVDLTATWSGEEPQRLTFGNRIPFSYPNFSEGRSGIVLMPPIEQVGRQERGGWVPETIDGHIPSQPVVRADVFESGNSASGRWTVWADPRNANYVRPGTYEFDDEVGTGGGDPIHWTLGMEIVNVP